MKTLKKILAVLLTAAMLLGILSACANNGESAATTNPPKTTEAPTEAPAVEYPVTPEELGSGEVKWSEEKTADGWMKVTNQGGETLGYSPDSGVKLIQVDGYAFKDLNRNGKLDIYEDWRQDDESRVNDLVASMNQDSCVALLVHPQIRTFVDDGVDALMGADSFNDLIDKGGRSVLTRGVNYPKSVEVKWNNNIQARAEGLPYGIPVNISTDPRIAKYSSVSGLSIAATFDPEVAQKLAEYRSQEYRSVGITTFLGPQVDLTTDPRYPWDDVFGEDPALNRDMTNATISGYQSTYDADGNDLGWGEDSVNTSMKHWVGNAAGEGGREAHDDFGKYNVFPGGQFETQLIPFVDGGLNLDSKTGQAATVMISYSVAYSEDGSLGDLVGTAFSDYKVQLLRDYGFDGVIITDFGAVTAGGNSYAPDDDMTSSERICRSLIAGVDQMGGTGSIEDVMEAYKLLEAEIGAENALVRIKESASRILRTFFQVGLFDNAYCSISKALEVDGNEESEALAAATRTNGVVMVKNEDNVISASSGEKKTIYVPLCYNLGITNTKLTSAARIAAGFTGTWELPVDLDELDKYFNVVTDTVGEPTGAPDKDGNPTYSYDDVIRASDEEIAACDLTLVCMYSPLTGKGYLNDEYLPISLQYGEYIARSESVRTESIAGDMVESEVETEYGPITTLTKENRTYYGKSITAYNYTELQNLIDTAERIPEDMPLVVALNCERSAIVAEIEPYADALLVGWQSGFYASFDGFLPIVAGEVEPSGLLPIQMPANMDTVEAQYEDVPRDMECYVDADGNTYDFAFGLNWSGVINDARTAKYNVAPLTAPALQPVK